MFSSFNPFKAAQYYSKVLPHSRALHTSLWEKIKDTFQVFDGGTGVFEDETSGSRNLFRRYDIRTRSGLFDYATLGIFRGIFAVHTLFINKWNKSGIVFKAFAFIPYVALSLVHMVGNGILVRHAVSAALTLAVSPIVLLAHLIAKIILAVKAHNVMKEIELLETDKGGRLKEVVQDTTLNLQRVLNDNNASLQTDVKVLYLKEKKLLEVIDNKNAKISRFYQMNSQMKWPNNSLVEVSKSVRGSTNETRNNFGMYPNP